MKVAFLTGSLPPDICGIGDYTLQLTRALSREGIVPEIVCRQDWRIQNMSGIIRHVRSLEPDLIHIQYPTAGFGWHLTPQAISLAVPCVVTVHEVSEAHVLRRLSLYPFSLRSRHLIFTTMHELDYAARYAPWILPRCSVIPIGSNIAVGERRQDKIVDEIVYFGLIRKNKGLEDIVALAGLLRQRKIPCSIRVIGKPYPPGSDYLKELQHRCLDLPIQWELDRDDETVVRLLSRAAMAYMPFPDGASGRRGSLLALLANGVATITTRGPHTPASLDSAALYARGPEEALLLIEQLRQDAGMRNRLSENARSFASHFSWQSIARQHGELYENLLVQTKKI